MTASGAEPLVPTFTGFVQDSADALILFKACLEGILHHVPRRPNNQERSQLIESGNIFIYEERASGIKRWTDGVAWSPSRVFGDFLIYRELDKRFAPGEKRRAIKRKRGSHPCVDDFQHGNSDSQENAEMPRPITPHDPLVTSEQDKELQRSLIGSLVDSYGFRADGLVKKTMSISINGISHHMVSYYKVDDVKRDALARPLQDPRLQRVSARPELYLKQNIRAPIEETETYAADQQGYANPRTMYQMVAGGQNMGTGQHYSTGQYPGTYAHPQMMYSTAANEQNMRPGQYYPAGQYLGMYAPMATSNTGNAAIYSTVAGTQWAQQPATSYAGRPSYTAASSYGGYYRSGSQSEAKLAESHDISRTLGYNSSNSASHAGECHGSYSSPDMMLQSPFQSPVQRGSSTFGSMGAPIGRSSYHRGGDLNLTSNSHLYQIYSAPQGPQSLPFQQHALHPRS
jgi:hypothetical protein